MKVLGNILWFCLAGVWMAIAYIVAGLIQFLFIVTIPLGVQSFKLAGFALWPFGRAAVKKDGSTAGARTVGNFIWFITAGWWLALGHFLTGVLLCITIIGIPFGKVSFRLAGLALVPFGKEIVDAQSAPAGSLAVEAIA